MIFVYAPVLSLPLAAVFTLTNAHMLLLPNRLFSLHRTEANGLEADLLPSVAS
jgi:hypothetical protein